MLHTFTITAKRRSQLLARRCCALFSPITILAFLAFFIVITPSNPAHAIQRSFLNNGFEDIWAPLVGANSNYCWVYDGSESPWLSNDNSAAGTGPCSGYNGGSYGTGSNIVEIWFNNFNGVPARAGKVHAELNANLASTIHQNVCVLQNEDITWRLSHRGRDGVDRMQYYVGNSASGMVLDASTGNNGSTAITACQSGTNVTTINSCTQATVNTWGDYGGVFKWLGPSAVTSVNFQAISTNGGNGSLTVGNFLDEVYFYLKPIVEFSAFSSSGLESVATPATPKLRVVGALTAPLSVSVSIIGGTATLGTDYTTPSGTANFNVTIPVGNYVDTNGVFTEFDTGIQILNDNIVNGSRTIIMQVNANSAYIISSSDTCGQAVRNPVTYTILDDDARLHLFNTTIGGTGTFNYNLTNVDTDLATTGNQTTAAITTITANTPVEFDANSGLTDIQPIQISAVGSDVNISETVPSGWSVSGSCSVTGGSNPTSSPIAINSLGKVTVPAANVTGGAIITCSYTNTKSLSLTKAFNTGTIGVGQTARLTYTITNPAGSPAQTGLYFTDTFPANLVVASSPNVINNCGGTTPTPAGGATSFVVSSVNAAVGTSTCTISVDVTSSSVGSYINGVGQITAISPLLTNGVTDQRLDVVQARLTKSFNPTTIIPDGTSSLIFTLTNGIGNPAQSGLNFIDTLPGSVKVAGTPNIRSNCPAGGTFTNNPAFVSATAGSNIITTSGAALSGTVTNCQIMVDVTSNTSGSYVNGPANNSISGLSANLASSVTDQTLTVQGVNLTKTFNTSSITVGQTATLTFIIENPAGTAQSGLNFTDTLPGSVKVAGTPNIRSNCPAGGAFSNNPAFVSAAANSGTITTTGAALNSGVYNCQVRVDVTSNTAGSYINGPTNSSISGLSANLINSVTDQTLNVIPVTLTKAYSPTTIDAASSTTLTFTLTNGSGNPAQTGITFTDRLAIGNGLTITGVTALTGTGCSTTTPTFTATSNPTVTLTNATMNAGTTTCTFTATVRGNTANSYPNSYTNGNITSSAGVINATGVDATLTVSAIRPTLGKAYNATNIAKGSTSTLTFTITNAAGRPAQSGISFTDTFPAGLTVTAVSAVSGTAGCSGTPGFTSSTVSLASGATAAGLATCTFTATVRGDTEGIYANDNTDFSGQTNINTTATAATLNVYAPPVVTKSFGATSIPAGSGYTTMTLTLINPATNPGNLSSVLVNDIFPSGMTPYTTVGITYGTNTGCTGTSLRDQNGNSLGATDTGARLTITTVVPGATCQATFNIESSTVGYATNTTQQPTATTTVGGVALTGTTASASINVGSPTLTKSFGTSPVGANQVSVLTFTLTNSSGNPSQSGLNFTDTLPGSVKVAATPNIQSNCPAGGTFSNNPAFVAAVAGSNTITTSGAAINSGVANCQIRLNVSSDTAGSFINGPTNSSISSHSSNLIDGVTDRTLVVTQPSLNKAFSPTTIDQGGTSTLTFTITNTGTNLAQSGISFTDNLPATVFVHGTPNIQSNCPSGGAFSSNPAFVSAPAGSGTITTTGAALNNGVTSCQIKVDVTSNTAGGPYNNTTANISGLTSITNSVTASGLTVQAKPVLTKAFSGTATISIGQTNTLTFTINNNVTNSIARSALAFTDTLPGSGGLTATATTNCTGGTVTVTGANNNIISFSGGSLNAGEICTVTATVTGVTAGSYINGPINSSISGVSTNLVDGVTNQSLTVTSLPSLTILKSALVSTGSPKARPGDTITYTITVTETKGSSPDPNSVILSDFLKDTISNYIDLSIDTYGTSPYRPFNLTPGTSGLTLGLHEYSTDGGITWVSNNPPNPSGGYDSTITNWRLTLNGTMAPSSSFSLNYSVKVK